MNSRLNMGLLAVLMVAILSAGLSVWWAYRNNHLYGNGRWIIGKDTGKFVFYTYDFMFRPLGRSGVDLSQGMAYQEILYHRPEDSSRQLARLESRVQISERGYLLLIAHKDRARMDVLRISNNGRFPPVFLRYDERGELVDRINLEHARIDPARWHHLRLERDEGIWRAYLDDALFAELPVRPDGRGYFGFKGSGLPRSPVSVRDIEMTFSDPATSLRMWVEREDFRPRYRDAKSLAGALPLAAAIIVLLGWRLRLLGHFVQIESRARYYRVCLLAWLAIWCVPLVFLKKESGLAFPLALIAGEFVQFALLGVMLRGSPVQPLGRGGRLEAALFGAVMCGLFGYSALTLGDSLGRFRFETIRNLSNVNPGAYLLHPDNVSSSPAYKMAQSVKLRPGEPYFGGGGVYRDQRMAFDFVPSEGVTMDVTWQVQSFLTRGDPDGEMLPLQRRLIRLSTRDDVPWGMSSQTGNRPVPFWALNGEVHAGEINRIEVVSDADGVNVLLNGELTRFPWLKPLGFGETILMVFEPSVEIFNFEIEPSRARVAREQLRLPVGFVIPLIWCFVIWLLFIPSGHSRFADLFLSTIAAFFPLAFFLLAALSLGAGPLSFYEYERKAWMDLALIGFVLSHLNLLVVGKDSIKAKAIYFNIIFIGLLFSVSLFVWDALLPEEHELKVRFNDQAVAPADMAISSGASHTTWYSNNRAIGANTFIWRQQFGHEHISFDKPAEKARIFLVGGSQAWGSGAASSSETFAELIERNLAAAGWDVEVFNAGVNGAGISKVRMQTEELLMQFAPDIIIADIGLNDSAGLAPIRNEVRVRELSEQYAGEFEAIVHVARAHGTDVVLCLEPMSSETPLRPSRYYYGLLREVAARHDVMVVEPGPALSEAEADYIVWWDTAHFAPRGHEIMAAEITPFVERVLRQRAGSQIQ